MKYEINRVRRPSEAKRNAFYSVFTKLNKSQDIKKKEDIFNNWLVGVVDGDGTFHFAQNKEGY